MHTLTFDWYKDMSDSMCSKWYRRIFLVALNL